MNVIARSKSQLPVGLFIVFLFALVNCGTTTHQATSASAQIAFSQATSPTTCPATTTQGANCLAVSGQGTTRQFGAISFQRTAILFSAPAGTRCAPASTAGELIITNADTVAINGSGTWCPNDGSATYTIAIAGGTGKFQHATGTGTITVPGFASSGENWSFSFSW